jgi:hypothetical protein
MRENAFASELPKGLGATFHANETRRISPVLLNATEILCNIDFRKNILSSAGNFDGFPVASRIRNGAAEC